VKSINAAPHARVRRVARGRPRRPRARRPIAWHDRADGTASATAVARGLIDTPLRAARFAPDAQRALDPDVGRAPPAGRAGVADDMARAVRSFVEHGFTTGAVLDADGGQR
jgi:hypothetical protein